MIDAAAFVGAWPWKPVGMGASDLARHLESHGITRALVTPLEGIFWEDPQPANESLAESIAGLPFAVVPAIDPTFPSWRRDLERCLGNPLTRAIRIFPGYRGFAVDHPACLELLGLAGRERIIVFVQLRMQDLRMQNRFARYPDVSISSVLGVAELFPETRIVLGGARIGELEETAGQIGRLDTVFVETSGVERVGGLRTLIRRVGAGRILLGTHTPLFLTKAAVLKLDETDLTTEERRLITEENARRLFVLEGGGARGRRS